MTPWTVAHQTLPSMGFSRQEYWSGLPFPSPGDLPNPEIEPESPALRADALASELLLIGRRLKEVVVSKEEKVERSRSCVKTLPLSIRSPKLVPSCQGQVEAQEKAGVLGEPLLGQRRRYLHETSTPGHQDPLRKAVGRTQGLGAARSRHLPAQQGLAP